MEEKTVSPETRLLSAQIRMGDPKAVKKIVSELKRAKGDVAKTAAALGCATRTLYLWVDASPELAAVFKEHVRSIGRPVIPKKPAKKAPAKKAKPEK